MIVCALPTERRIGCQRPATGSPCQPLRGVTFLDNPFLGGSLPPPALGEGGHRGLARRLVAVRRCAIPVLPVGQSPQGASFGAARSVDKPRFIPIIVPTAGRGH